MRGVCTSARVMALSLGLALALPSASAAADRKAAASHFQKGIQLFQAEDFAAALIEFRAAYDTAPSFEVLYNIALCQARLAKHAAAVSSFEAYLSDGGSRVSKERRKVVSRLLEEARAKTALVTIISSIEGTEVFIDGVSAGFTPLIKLLTESGSRTFRAVREGYHPAEEVQELAAGQTTTLQLELKPIAASAPKPQEPVEVATGVQAATPPVPIQPPQPRAREVPAIGVAGMALGAVLVGGGIGATVHASSVGQEIDALYARGGTWDSTWERREQEAEIVRTLGVIGCVTGTALLIAGGAINLIALLKPDPDETSAAMIVTPLAQGGAWVSVGGKF